MGMDEHQRDVEIEHQGDDEAEREPDRGDADETWGADETIGDADSPGT